MSKGQHKKADKTATIALSKNQDGIKLDGESFRGITGIPVVSEDHNTSATIMHPDKLHHLHALCKSSLTLSINPQRDIYQSASSFLLTDQFYAPFINPRGEVYKEIVRTDTLISIKFSVSGNVHCVVHHDLNHALDEAIKILEK